MAGKDEDSLLGRLGRAIGLGAKPEPESPATAAPRAGPQMSSGAKRPAFDTPRHPLTDGLPPDWASGWGEDRHGIFVDFTLGEVTQRLRWIGPGTFRMGSPNNEPGRWMDEDTKEHGMDLSEGPQHDVRLTQGFWLFDTPVTQALWEAVMGSNPSRFVSPDRPVEQVSWDEADAFIAKVNGMVPGLDLVLPTEAQWEYACRAGTTTATYAGPMEILGECNAPVLDAIAWYGGNSGVGFELENGWDSSDWPNKQHDHKTAGTRPVGLKQPNAWGLYDMLGNVWEWCADDLLTYDEAPKTDPFGPQDKRSRSLRGGSWRDDARCVHAVHRSQGGRDIRDSRLGFRCAGVRE